MVAKGVGGEKDNPIRIDRDNRDRAIPKLRFYYIILWVVCIR
jgi:hypothetical protein